MRARRGSPGRAPSRACSSPAASTTSWVVNEVPADNYNYPGQEDRQPFAARPRRHASRRGSPAMARPGTATAACCGPKASSSSRHGVRRGPASHPPHRGRCRRQRDPASRSRRQSRLLPHAAYVFLPRQCRPSRARRGLALSGADPATWCGPRMPATDYRRPECRLPHGAGAATEFPRTGLAARDGRRRGMATCRWRSSTIALGLGFEVVTRKDQLPCAYRVAEFPGRAVCAGHRAFDASMCSAISRRANAAR